MKDFDLLIAECLKEVRQVGIVPAENIKWTINRRAKKRWGQCKKSPDGSCEIQIAERLLADDNVSVKDCKDTIIHELLHSCRECHGHTGKWKEYANLMNETYGYRIKRTASYAEMGLKPVETVRRKAKYIYVCRCCGQVISKTRKCKFTRYYKRYGCGICGTKRAFYQLKD